MSTSNSVFFLLTPLHWLSMLLLEYQIVYPMQNHEVLNIFRFSKGLPIKITEIWVELKQITSLPIENKSACQKWLWKGTESLLTYSFLPSKHLYVYWGIHVKSMYLKTYIYKGHNSLIFCVCSITNRASFKVGKEHGMQTYDIYWQFKWTL